MIKVGTDFSGIGAPEQALKELGIEHSVEFACDKDKYARETYLANHSAKIMYEDVTTRDNTTAPKVDFYFFGFPCQSFSLSGKRAGFDDVRGTLFFNSADYIKKQRPKVFVAENVKGLLSHDKPKGSKAKFGRTFSTIINLLGKTVNGQMLMPMYDDNLGYNIYYTVLNAKYYDLPQNRERIFIVGFRDDVNFSFPQNKVVTKRLIDILEPVVDEKYFLSNKMLAQYITFEETGNEISVKGEVTPNSQCGKVYGSEGLFPTIIAGTHGYAMGYIEEPVCAAMRGRYEGDQINQHLEQRTDGITNTLTSVQKDNLIIVKEATKKGYAIANEGDSINLSNINSETRRGRVVVGVGVANTLDTSCNQAVVVGETINNRIAGWHENENVVGAHRNDKKRSSVSEHIYHKEEGICTTIQAAHIPKLYGKRIRRLTERECLRLQGFSDSFITPCSGTQTYKQSGNSIPVTVLKAIILNIQKALNGKI